MEDDDEGIVDEVEDEVDSDLGRDNVGPENIVNERSVDDDTQSTKSWQSDETEFNGFGDDSGINMRMKASLSRILLKMTN